jgi:hypothetical protein
MPEQIGLQSVLDNEQFLQALQQYQASINKLDSANDALTGSYKEVNQAETGAQKQTEKTTKAQGEQRTAGKNLYGMYTELNSGLSIVKQGMQAVGQIIDATIGSFMRQAEEVRSLALATGATYAETSRLIQVFDDAGVDASRLRAAMLALKNQGIAPSIDSIATLADQYRAIKDPNEKVIFLTKNLGARGTELGKVFDMTGEQIRDAGKAVSESLIFDEEKIALAEKARIAQDEWNDTLKGFGNNIALFVLPGLMNFIGGTKQLIAAVVEANKSILDNAVATGTLRNRDIDAAEAAEFNAKAIELGNKALGDRYDSAIKATQVDEALTKATIDLSAAGRYQREMFVTLTDVTAGYEAKAKALAIVQAGLAAGISGPLKSAYAGYTSTMADLSGKQGDLMLQMQTLLNQGYSPESEALLKLQREYIGLNGEMLSAEEAFKLATAQMIYQQAAAGLDADAALNLARAMGLVSESDYNLATAIETLKTKREAGVIGEEAYTKAILDLNTAAGDGKVTLEEVATLMASLDGKVSSATVNIETNYTETHTASGKSKSGKGHATGGTIPAGQATLVGERRPEVITPRHDSYVYPSTSNYYQNYSNQMNMQMGGVNVSNGMDVAAFKAMIMQTVSEAMAMRA